MKATLEFALPDEEAEHRVALAGAKRRDVCRGLGERLRSAGKHEDRKTVGVDEARERLREEPASRGLSFE